MLNKFGFFSIVAFALCGCSDYWNTYHVVDDVSDMVMPDLATPLPCTQGEEYVRENDSTFLACCGYQNPATNASNVQATFRASQQSAMASSVQVTVKFSCAGSTIGLSQSDPAGVSKTAFVPIVRKTVVEGGGTTLDANNVQRFFVVSANAELQVRNIRLINGRAIDYPAGYETPFLNFAPSTVAALGGSILALGSVNLDRVGISGSSAENTTRAHGGAIFTGGPSLVITNSILYKNRTSAENGVAGNSSLPMGGAAITAVNTAISVSTSTIIENVNHSTNTIEPKGIIEIVSQRAGQGNPAKFEKNIMVNYVLDSRPSNYSVWASCALTSPISGLLASTNVIDKYKDSQASCGPWVAISPNPTNLTAPASFAFNNPFVKSRPGMITTVQSVDDSMKSATKWTCNGEPDFFGISRPVGVLCMPGAVTP